jgi:hypothetical protein
MDVMQCDADTGAMWIYDSGGSGDGGGDGEEKREGVWLFGSGCKE